MNNAGGQFASPLASITQKGWETVVRTNLTGGFLCARECYTQWMAEHGGAIVNIVADMWGSMPGMGHSGAARAGMVSFTETAAVEWATSGVRVNAVAPGWIASSGMDTYPDWMQALPPPAHAGRADAAAGHGVGDVGGDLLPPLARRRVHLRLVLRVDGAAPNAKLASPLSAIVPDAERAAAEGRQPWPLPAHDRAPTPWNGFHLASTPRVLAGRVTAPASALVQQLEHPLRRPGDHRALAPDDHRPLHQLRDARSRRSTTCSRVV